MRKFTLSLFNMFSKNTVSDVEALVTAQRRDPSVFLSTKYTFQLKGITVKATDTRQDTLEHTQ
jgi:hypothetical protein